MSEGDIQYFELPDGRKINIHTGEPASAMPSSMAQIPKHSEARETVAATRRKLVDLPALPEKMNVISVVVSYVLFGLSEDEIAIALQVSADRIRAIKMLDAYTEMYDQVVEGIKSRDLDPINKLIEDSAPTAVARITELVQQSDSDATSLKAAQDILDRSGRRAADIHEHRVMHEGGLVIEHIERSEHADVEQMNDALDVDFTTVEDEGSKNDDSRE